MALAVTLRPRMRLWLCLAAYGGLRCHEIAGLAVEDIDLEDDPTMLRLRTTKGDKPRGVALAGATLEALAAVELPRTGPAFPGLTARVVSAKINAFLDRCGIDATAHQLRHWFGTEVYRGTRDLRLVQELLGHADISTTAGYVALVPSPADGGSGAGVGPPPDAAVRRSASKLASTPPLHPQRPPCIRRRGSLRVWRSSVDPAVASS